MVFQALSFRPPTTLQGLLVRWQRAASKPSRPDLRQFRNYKDIKLQTGLCRELDPGPPPKSKHAKNCARKVSKFYQSIQYTHGDLFIHSMTHHCPSQTRCTNEELIISILVDFFQDKMQDLTQGIIYLVSKFVQWSWSAYTHTESVFIIMIHQ